MYSELKSFQLSSSRQAFSQAKQRGADTSAMRRQILPVLSHPKKYGGREAAWAQSFQQSSMLALSLNSPTQDCKPGASSWRLNHYDGLQVARISPLPNGSFRERGDE